MQTQRIGRRAETEAMKEIIGLYGKTWHFWQIDWGDQLPLGHPVLMGSLTESTQIDLDPAVLDRNVRFRVDHETKAENRSDIVHHDVHHQADSWWKEAKNKCFPSLLNQLPSVETEKIMIYRIFQEIFTSFEEGPAGVSSMYSHYMSYEIPSS